MKIKKVKLVLEFTPNEYVWFMAWVHTPKDYDYDEIKEMRETLIAELETM